MAKKNTPFGNNSTTVNLLPKFYQTATNSKFLNATIEQLYQPGATTKINGYVGRQNAKAATASDIFIQAQSNDRQNYQLEPGVSINDDLNNIKFYKDYIDYINQINVFGGNTLNHSRLNEQEFYSWDPHIDWDKFVNFQNYYWLPYGPDTIDLGLVPYLVSTYSVNLQPTSDANVYVFSPDGKSYNPILKLYKGITYKFVIDSPNNPFSIKTFRSIGESNRYSTKDLINGIEKGTLTFTVPFDAPSLLFYQSETDINVGGAIEISTLDESFIFDVEKDLIGKRNFTLSNGQSLSNGMKISFANNVLPKTYSTGEYYVEGVGSAIKLIKAAITNVAGSYALTQTTKFDFTPFDTEPFGDSIGYPADKDYFTINRASKDANPWSRYNRWFHKDVIIASALYNNAETNIDQLQRAVRPIIEFEADLKLYNFGNILLADIDVIDTYTTDVFSIIEGSKGYNIDGINLSDGHLVLFTADTDELVKNKIYKVSFVNILGYRQIHLEEYATPTINNTVIVRQGVLNQGKGYWFDGSTWLYAQQKTTVNQPPKFDIVDDNGISFSNFDTYPSSTFTGTTLFEYKKGNSIIDPVLGFSLAYQNVNNIGDIVFNFTLETDSFNYKINNAIVTKNINVGYLSKLTISDNIEFVNGWTTSSITDYQAAVRIYKNILGSSILLDAYDDANKLDDIDIKVYINGNRINRDQWTLTDTSPYKTIQLSSNIQISTNDIITVRSFSSQPINDNAFYEIPINLQNNPLNGTIGDFTLGEVINHVDSIIDNISNLGPSYKNILPIDFIGTFPGSSNLRDCGNLTSYGTKFVQHSGPSSLSLYHVTNENNNIVKALEQANADYNNFKRQFINTVSSLGYDADAYNIVNKVFQQITLNKPSTAPYYFSDMVPFGASVKTNLNVADYRIKKYPLTSVFTLDELSNKAVGVYLNGNQLLYKKDYIFDELGFIEILCNLNNDDVITTYEYESTDGCFVPATPTKLGLWPIYEPKIYLDTSLITPRWMIQGHDGSQVLAYGSYSEGDIPDYRDNVILELEKRIFNNIKVQYDPTIFNIYDIFPRYDRPSKYTLEEFNEVLAPAFYKWTELVGANGSKPLNYDINNSFTFNYTGHELPNKSTSLGYWRGIYRYVFDTDRPNLCPWEMLGLTIEPSWWTEVYGEAPYTNNNIPMWKDISEGIIREPGKQIVYLDDYKKPFLLNHIPVDEYGNLLSPLSCGITKGTITPSVNGKYVFGDVAPVEAAWRRSSHFPFSIITACSILMPSKVFGVAIDRSRIVRNKANQLIYKDTSLRITPNSIQLPSVYTSSVRVQTAGIINYIVDLIFNYIFSNNLKSYEVYANDLSTMTVQLGYRTGSFTSKDQFSLLLESKTPLSSGNLFVPQEDFTVVLKKSNPVRTINYSGIIITKISTGYEVKGYSKTHPFFNYYSYIKTSGEINIGGISSTFVNWSPNSTYHVGVIVFFDGNYYRAKQTVTSGQSFNLSEFSYIPALPVTGGRTVQNRISWDRKNIIKVPYGHEFTTVQEVYDFIIGYGEYLKDQGLIFDDYNNNLGNVSNWNTSAKEFLFWTTQSWHAGQEKWSDWLSNQPILYGTVVRYNGDYYSAKSNLAPSAIFDYDNYIKLDGLSNVGNSVISLSPAAYKISVVSDYAVVDNISNPFNTYEFYKVNGNPIPVASISISKIDNVTSFSLIDDDGIYSASFYLVQHEHVVVIKNKSIFNDIIYNLESGYRRDRIKVSGYITSDWNGSFDVPGFVVDQAVIEVWKAWTDYNVGDVVNFQGNYYTANVFIAGSTEFEIINWSKLNYRPVPTLIPNWTNLATQFTDFYNLDSDGLNGNQQKIAQHLIGYQRRSYLKNILQDNISEFKFYQGMIRDKGTENVLTNLFGVLGADGKDSLTFYEEWALRTGRYGATSSYEEIEFVIPETNKNYNPLGVILTNTVDTTLPAFLLQQTPNDIYLKPLDYSSTPFITTSLPKTLLRDAGYVNNDDVKVSLGTLGEITTYNPKDFVEGDYAYCAFVGTSWNVYKYINSNLSVSSVTYLSNILTITFTTLSGLKAGDYIGIYSIDEITNFYKVASATLNSITISTVIKGWVNPFTQTNDVKIFKFIPYRIANIDNLDSVDLKTLTKNSLVWADSTYYGSWGVYKNSNVYTEEVVENPIRQPNLLLGTAIAVSKDSKFLASSTSQGRIIVYNKAGESLPWTYTQLIERPAISSDNSYLISATLTASSTVIYSSAASNSHLGGKVVGTGIRENTYVISVSPGVSLQLSLSAASSGLNSLTIITNVNTSTTGSSLALSEDGTWLAVGSPFANYATSNYVGNYNNSTTYAANSIVTLSTTIDGVTVTTAYKASSQTSGTLVVDSTTRLPVGNIPWTYMPYIPVDTTGTNSTLTNQGAVSIYNRDINGVYNLVDTILSPNPADNEKFGYQIYFTSGLTTNISESLYISAIGHSSNAGRVYKLDYGNITKVSTSYNPIGSSGTTIKVQSTSGISKGMTVVGTGFSSGQTVKTVVDTKTLILSLAPDSTPTGTLNFGIIGWGFFDFYANYVGDSNTQNFGTSIVAYNNKLAISGLSSVTNQGTAGYVNIYTNLKYGSAKPSPQRLFRDLSSLDPQLSGKISFGKSIDFSPNGLYLVVSDVYYDKDSSPLAGKVAIYSQQTNDQFILLQELVNHHVTPSGNFGSHVSFLTNNTVIVYSITAANRFEQIFDNGDTTFDNDRTFILEPSNPNGRVDIYDRYNTTWVYSESLDGTFDEPVGYGSSIAASNNCVLVGSPNALDKNIQSGKIYYYTKLADIFSWQLIDYGQQVPDVTKIKKAFLYNNQSNNLLTYIDVIDPLQGKIAGPAEEEIKYKTFYDPAKYSNSTHTNLLDEKSFWTDKQVGLLWWDLRNAKFLNNYSSNYVYRTSLWNTLAPSASIDIYEWVETNLLPSKWDALADTPTGLAQNISGTSLYGDDVYSVRKTYDNISKSYKSIYYYWVKNKKIVPSNISGRHISANDVSLLISNPRGQGYVCAALTGNNSFNLINVSSYLSDLNTIFSLEYWTIDKTDQNIHTQWKIISNDASVTLPNFIIEKWIDSLCGYDAVGRSVPDLTQPAKLRYGIENRPRQSMFINRIEALKQIIEYVNDITKVNQISEIKNLSTLESYETEPNQILGLYDDVIDTDLELRFTSATSFKQPNLNIQVSNDGKIVGITINYAGQGYKNAPYIDVVGTGTGAVVQSVIDSLGRIVGVTIVEAGQGYDSNTYCTIRNYSALVHTDLSSSNSWAIYSYNPNTTTWTRIRTQAYDVRKYWEKIDWYATGYNQFTLADFVVDTTVDLNSINDEIGNIVKVKTDSKGQWTLLEKISNSSSVFNDWTQIYKVIGIENGTIQFKSNLYNFVGTDVGYDSETYGSSDYDIVASKELRLILKSLNNDILTNDLKQEFLNLFFISVKYSLSEQLYVDWIFKTSFVKANYNLGMLDQPVNYPIDNLKDFEDYISEVKPYRTKIREYISQYQTLDNNQTAVSDFDMPPVYENGSIKLVNSFVTANDTIRVLDPAITTAPWKNWYDNVGFKIIEIKLIDGGSGYVYEPSVVINSKSGKGAKARAFISNGKVRNILILDYGTNYLSTPIISIVGGLSASGIAAKAVAIIGDGVVRSNLLGIKFDRITKNYFITQNKQIETFVGSGSLLQFALKWPPDVRVGQSSVTVNGQPVLRENYSFTIVTTKDSYTKHTGLLVLSSAPPKNSQIVVSYQIDQSVFTAVDRIQYYYNPESGSFGKDLSQLMLGVDYGGVVVSGLSFSTPTGYDSEPFMASKWDAFDSTNNNFTVILSANTRTITLPFTPLSSDVFNIYKEVVAEQLINGVDGITTSFNYSLSVYDPEVYVSKTSNTGQYLNRTFSSVSFVGSIITMVINDTTGIVKGMGIVGTGFGRSQLVDTIINSTTVTLTALPNVSLVSINQPLVFTFNYSGSSTLIVSSTQGVYAGDTVSSTTNTFTYGTKVKSVVNSTTIILDNILYNNIPLNSTVKFQRKLTNLIDVTISPNGVIKFTNAPTAGSNIRITGRTNPLRLDDEYYDTVRQKNKDAILASPTGYSVDSITVLEPGIYTRIPKILIQNSPIAGNSPEYTATVSTISAQAVGAIISSYGTGYAVGDTLTVANQATFKITALNTNTGTVISTSGADVTLSSTQGMAVGDSFVIAGNGTGLLQATSVYYVSSVSNNTIHLANSLANALIDNFIIFPNSTVSNTTFNSASLIGRPKTLVIVTAGTFSGNLTNTAQATTTNSLYGTGCTLILQYGIKNITVSQTGGGYITAPNILIGTPWSANLPVSLNDDVVYQHRHYLVTVAGTLDSSPPLHITGSIVYGTAELTYIGPAASAFSTLSIGKITLPQSLTVNDGDTFIIRNSTSDGSYQTKDSDYDTALSGGDLTYSTALGIAADDIIVDGDGFVTATTSPAPEEVVPGQIVDSLAVKVFDTQSSSSAQVKVDNYSSDGVTTGYKISQTPNSKQSVIVKVGADILTYDDDYTIDYKNKTINLSVAPSAGTIISIFSLGFGGKNILDLDYFIGNGNTTEFVTKATWQDDITVLVYVNGIVSSPQVFRTDGTYIIENSVGFRYGAPPVQGDLINYVIVSGSLPSFTISSKELIYTNGSISYQLQQPIGNNLPLDANMIVRNGQNILTASTNSYFTIGKNRLNYTIDKTVIVPGSVIASQIFVSVGDTLLTFGTDYVLNLNGITITITRNIYTQYSGKTLVISVTRDNQYFYNSVNNTIRFSQNYNGDIIEVMSFYVHDILDIQRTSLTYNSSSNLTADSVAYFDYKEIGQGTIKLDRAVLDDSYVWVTKNNKLLVPGIDYRLVDNNILQLNGTVVNNDVISLMTFDSNLTNGSRNIAYMQFKDMLNRTTYKRLSAKKQTYLIQDLNYNDRYIRVNDTSNLTLPNKQLNKPGVVEIQGERIEYFEVRQNTLSQLRRGTLGTGVRNIYVSGSYVQDIGASETIPYVDDTKINQIISDGTTTINLDYIPKSVNEIEVFVGGYDNLNEWSANVAYEVNDIVVVGQYTYRCLNNHTSSSTFTLDLAKWTFFVGNIRLKKTSYKTHNVNKAPYSPAGDITMPADFTVDGLTAKITLTNNPPIGIFITIVRKTGISWDVDGLFNTNNKIANFIKEEPGIWYYSYKDSAYAGRPAQQVFTLDDDKTSMDGTNLTFDQG
jgi:uncharacterized protein YuzE